jgi:hypothetical protein
MVAAAESSSAGELRRPVRKAGEVGVEGSAYCEDGVTWMARFRVLDQD